MGSEQKSAKEKAFEELQALKHAAEFDNMLPLEELNIVQDTTKSWPQNPMHAQLRN